MKLLSVFRKMNLITKFDYLTGNTVYIFCDSFVDFLFCHAHSSSFLPHIGQL